MNSGPGGMGAKSKKKAPPPKKATTVKAKQLPMSLKSPRIIPTMTPIDSETCSKKKIKLTIKKPETKAKSPTGAIKIRIGKILPTRANLTIKSSSDDDDNEEEEEELSNDVEPHANAEKSCYSEIGDGGSSDGSDDFSEDDSNDSGLSAELPEAAEKWLSPLDRKSKSQSWGEAFEKQQHMLFNPQQQTNEMYYQSAYAGMPGPDIYHSRYGGMGFGMATSQHMGMGGQVMPQYDQHPDQDDSDVSEDDDDESDSL